MGSDILVITRVEQVVDVDGPPELPEGRAAAYGAEGAVFFVADVRHGEDWIPGNPGLTGVDIR